MTSIAFISGAGGGIDRAVTSVMLKQPLRRACSAPRLSTVSKVSRSGSLDNG